jgi:ketosteroid isomerase-like protein
MSEPNPRTVFERFLDAAVARDLATLDSVVHPDFEDWYPQSGERIRGLANMQAILEHYPGGGYEGQGTKRIVGTEDRWVVTPSFSIQRIEGSGDTYTGVTRGHYPDGMDWHIVTIGQVRDGRVWRAETYFAPEFEAPAWRAEWVERD